MKLPDVYMMSEYEFVEFLVEINTTSDDLLYGIRIY